MSAFPEPPRLEGLGLNLKVIQVLQRWMSDLRRWLQGGGAGTVSPLTTKGDIWGYDTTDNRIPVGTDNQFLTAQSAATLGVQWNTFPRQHTYAYAASVAADAGIYDVVDITLTGPLTLTFTNGVDGKAIMVRLRQDGTGGRLVTFGTGLRLSTDITSFTASTTASKLDWLLFRYTSADSKYDLLAYNRGF